MSCGGFLLQATVKASGTAAFSSIFNASLTSISHTWSKDVKSLNYNTSFKVSGFLVFLEVETPVTAELEAEVDGKSGVPYSNFKQSLP